MRQGRFNWTGGAQSIREISSFDKHFTVPERCADRGLMLDRTSIVVDNVSPASQAAE